MEITKKDIIEYICIVEFESSYERYVGVRLGKIKLTILNHPVLIYMVLNNSIII